MSAKSLLRGRACFEVSRKDFSSESHVMSEKSGRFWSGSLKRIRACLRLKNMINETIGCGHTSCFMPQVAAHGCTNCKSKIANPHRSSVDCDVRVLLTPSIKILGPSTDPDLFFVLDSRLGTGSVDGPSILMEGVRGEHEHHNQQKNDEEEDLGWFAILLLQLVQPYAATCVYPIVFLQNNKLKTLGYVIALPVHIQDCYNFSFHGQESLKNHSIQNNGINHVLTLIAALLSKMTQS